jgi:hypothetical protein
LDPPPCQTGWLASPCTCNGLWLHSCMALFSKRTIFFVTDQTPRPYQTRCLPAQILAEKFPDKFFQTNMNSYIFTYGQNFINNLPTSMIVY